MRLSLFGLVRKREKRQKFKHQIGGEQGRNVTVVVRRVHFNQVKAGLADTLDDEARPGNVAAHSGQSQERIGGD